MSHLQNYQAQIGGFDFSLAQRYRLINSEMNFSRRIPPSNQYPIKKQEQPLSELNLPMVLYSQPIQEQQEDPLQLRKTARKFITQHPTYMPAVLVQLQIPNSSIFSCLQTQSYNGLTLVVKLASVPILPQLRAFFIVIKVISVPISSQEDTMYWVGIL